jgi:hypothetical protein
MSEELTLSQVMEICLGLSESFFGDSDGPFSASRARTIEADEELDRRGLGPRSLGFGDNQKAGDADKLAALMGDVHRGDADAFEAAMRYVSTRLFNVAGISPDLAFLAGNVLIGKTPRPAKRKSKESGLRGRNFAVFALVEIVKEGAGTSAEEAYSFVASELLKRGRSPNNALTVKKIHLAMRAQLGGELTIHDLAVLQSFPFLPNGLADLAERRMAELTRR